MTIETTIDAMLLFDVISRNSNSSTSILLPTSRNHRKKKGVYIEMVDELEYRETIRKLRVKIQQLDDVVKRKFNSLINIMQ